MLSLHGEVDRLRHQLHEQSQQFDAERAQLQQQAQQYAGVTERRTNELGATRAILDEVTRALVERIIDADTLQQLSDSDALARLRAVLRVEGEHIDRQQRRELEVENAALHKRVAELEQEIRSRHVEYQRAQRSDVYKGYQDEALIDRLRYELEAMQAEVVRLRESLEQQKQQTLSRQALIAELKEECDAWRSRSEKRAAEVRELREQVTRMQTDRDALLESEGEDSERLRGLADSQIAYATGLEHKVVALQRDLKAAQNAHRDTLDDLDKLREHTRIAQESHDERTRQFSAMERQLQERVESLARERVGLTQREHDAICAVRALARLLDDEHETKPPF
jgi:hypothetical protein